MGTITYYTDVFPLMEKSLYHEVLSSLPPYRLEKINALSAKEEKIRSMGAELLLRQALSDIGIKCYKVRADGNGKPFLDGCDIHFNLSHSGYRVMCSISDDAVGCDVELIKQISPEMAKNLLHNSEYLKIIDDGAEVSSTFFRYWTLKESFLKTIGLGLSVDPRTFSCVLGSPISMDQSVDERRYYFKEYRTDSDYAYAVCSIKDDFEEEMRFVDIRQIMTYNNQ